MHSILKKDIKEKSNQTTTLINFLNLYKNGNRIIFVTLLLPSSSGTDH